MNRIGGTKILYASPFSFLPSELFFSKVLDFKKKEVWTEGDLEPDPRLSGIITNTGWDFIFSEKHLKLYPNIKLLVTPSTGVDHIDLNAMASFGVRVYSLLDDRVGLSTISASSEFAFLLALSQLRKFNLAMSFPKIGKWRGDGEDVLRGNELWGQQVGLYGFGRIGKKLAKYFSAFDSKVSFFDPYVDATDFIKLESLERLFAENKIIIICCELNESTKLSVTKVQLNHMQSHSILVNVARGEIIHEDELSLFLKARSDVHYACDVITGENQGIQFQSPLIELALEDRVILTPHVAGATFESQAKAAEIAIRQAERFFSANRILSKEIAMPASD